jgi:hypothetical protein
VPIIMFWRRVSAETVETNKPVSTDNPWFKGLAIS